ncbi:MAG: DUF2336 domain-containing protein [Rhodospirillales bacterium]|nr:DUF2336 domain-containing protein [Rhodospirillales bacterium]MDH3918030.1 DUF2336 domain-containing protein [Rhodospirillales bacterium]
MRADLAARSDIRPEILYFLAADSSPEVRRRTAVNVRTPAQADLMLARDSDETVRRDLAVKVARLVPQLGERDQEQAQRYVVETLELLARDHATRVRQVLADALHDLVDAPPSVIRRLAQDTEEIVACPVLEFSPLLADRDLLDIIGEGCASGKLKAISRRGGLGETVADAIIGTEDRDAIAALLVNDSAQIREETLDSLVDQARDVKSWHEPLVGRSRLSPGMVRKLAAFVADNLLRKLQGREELDRETAKRVAEEVRRRLADGAKADGGANETPKDLAQRLQDTGQLDDEALLQALARGDRALVREALVLRTGMDEATVDRILGAGSAKGVTALAWKAGLAMRVATQLQLRMGGISPSDVLHARGGVDYPLTPDEMDWQLGFFQTLSA